ncbi:alpha/beta fold hydrolase [Priestia aryabhattai]|uniref:alpha/beta fold hydrolase n=1 Tax=Priestia aryabhattai TaxID=412384 RepID=UPI0015F70069|nr:alpha/beta hydrolase [Priestia aryabhattai]
MSYLDTGGNKEVLVMIHGLGSKRQSWDFQVNELSKHYRLIIPNLRGHADDKINYNITLQTMAADIIDLLDSLHIKECHFIGLSLGGIVVQELLHSYPRYVKSIILSNTASILPYWIGKYTVDQRMDKLGNMDDKDYEYSATKNCLHGYYPDSYIHKISNMFLDVNRNTYMQAASAPLGINYTNTLIHNSKPMLVIGSIFDRVTPYINTLTTYMLARNAKLKTFYNSGHIPNIEEPEEFNKCVLEFLHNIN